MNFNTMREKNSVYTFSQTAYIGKSDMSRYFIIRRLQLLRFISQLFVDKGSGIAVIQ